MRRPPPTDAADVHALRALASADLARVRPVSPKATPPGRSWSRRWRDAVPPGTSGDHSHPVPAPPRHTRTCKGTFTRSRDFSAQGTNTAAPRPPNAVERYGRATARLFLRRRRRPHTRAARDRIDPQVNQEAHPPTNQRHKTTPRTVRDNRHKANVGERRMQNCTATNPPLEHAE
jgi:hypothetical protein